VSGDVLQSLGFSASVLDSSTRKDSVHLEHRNVIVRFVVALTSVSCVTGNVSLPWHPLRRQLSRLIAQCSICNSLSLGVALPGVYSHNAVDENDNFQPLYSIHENILLTVSNTATATVNRKQHVIDLLFIT